MKEIALLGIGIGIGCYIMNQKWKTKMAEQANAKPAQ